MSDDDESARAGRARRGYVVIDQADEIVRLRQKPDDF